MNLQELLKDNPEVLKAVEDAIAKVNEVEPDKLKHVRFADLSEGAYVSKAKYTELEKALEQEKKEDLKDEKKLQALEDENLDKTIRLALSDVKTKDIDYMAYKLRELGEIKLDESGGLKGFNEKIETLKTKHPNMFTSEEEEIQEKKLIKGEEPEQAEPENLAQALKGLYEERS